MVVRIVTSLITIVILAAGVCAVSWLMVRGLLVAHPGALS